MDDLSVGNSDGEAGQYADTSGIDPSLSARLMALIR
jgi:hypothetical protein